MFCFPQARGLVRDVDFILSFFFFFLIQNKCRNLKASGTCRPQAWNFILLKTSAEQAAVKLTRYIVLTLTRETTLLGKKLTCVLYSFNPLLFWLKGRQGTHSHWQLGWSHRSVSYMPPTTSVVLKIFNSMNRSWIWPCDQQVKGSKSNYRTPEMPGHFCLNVTSALMRAVENYCSVR